MCDGIAGIAPCIEPAVEHVNLMVAEEFEKPEQPCGTHSGDVVIDDNVAVAVHAFGLDEMFDDPHECRKRLRPRIDERNSKDIETPGTGNVTVCVSFGRPHVHNDHLRIRQSVFQISGGPQQIRIRVGHEVFSSNGTSSEMDRTV